MKAEIYSTEGKLIRSIEADKIMLDMATYGSAIVLKEGKAVAAVLTGSVLLVDDNIPPNWESPK